MFIVTLNSNYNDFNSTISLLYDTLNSGSNELSNGTTQLRTETSDMDTQVQDTIDDMVQSIKGSDMETVSFVSQKNKDVKSV